MEWYYALNNEQKGPVSPEELADKFKSGVLDKDTLLFRAGMSDWQRAETVWAELGLDSLQSGFVRQGNEATAAAVPSHGHASKKFVYGGFWIRLLGSIIDGIIINVVCFIPGFIIGLSMAMMQIDAESPDGMMMMNIIIQFVSFLVSLAYLVFFMGRYGATLGMMALGLKIIVAGGGKVSYTRAAGRYLASFLSAMILGIGYLMIAFDDKKRSLHDRICDTRIIKERESVY